jgi:hypothetical protein
MGAYGYVLPGATSTKLQLRVGPVPKRKVGDILAWIGTNAGYSEESLQIGETTVKLESTEIFQNRPDCPVARAGVEFALTATSPNTYEGTYERIPRVPCDLKGLEKGGVLRASFPRDLVCESGSSADILVILKEPTLGVEIEAILETKGNALSGSECLNAVAAAISRVSSSVGQEVQACVVENSQYGEFDLLVAKQDLSAATGIFTLSSRVKE